MINAFIRNLYLTLTLLNRLSLYYFMLPIYNIFRSTNLCRTKKLKCYRHCDTVQVRYKIKLYI